MNIKMWSRRIHRWTSVAIAAPLLVTACTGTLLMLKKKSNWIQPPTQSGSNSSPSITFDQILKIASGVNRAHIQCWADVDRLDVRPDKGIVKVRAKNRWEIQIDTTTGEVLQVAYRRSDLIESLHDGSWFHDSAKLAVFLPSALLLLVVWFTGLYLFWLPYQVRIARRRRNRKW